MDEISKLHSALPLLEKQQISNEIETRLRKYMHEVMSPFDNRLKELQKSIYLLNDGQNLNKNEMANINQKIDKDIKLRDYVTEQNGKILTLVTASLIIF